MDLVMKCILKLQLTNVLMESLRSVKKIKKLKDDFRRTAASLWKCLLHAKPVILRGQCNYDYQPHPRNKFPEPMHLTSVIDGLSAKITLWGWLTLLKTVMIQFDFIWYFCVATKLRESMMNMFNYIICSLLKKLHCLPGWKGIIEWCFTYIDFS